MWVGKRSRHDGIGRNGVVGLRTKTTLASDEAWFAAQRAGATLTFAAGVASAVGGLLSLFFTDSDATTAAIVLGTAAAVLAIVFLAARAGQRAAGGAHDA